jgi:Na+/H+-dicarboxylate symporter
MNGTALYEAVAVIFIAQITGKTLSFIDISLTR